MQSLYISLGSGRADNTVEPLNVGPAKSVLIREKCPHFRGELIHGPIALGLYKGVRVFAFQGVHI